tara:strand:- start:264 stop:509 length:246 start_codon:yes stop_codon:yes gene_type:complete
MLKAEDLTEKMFKSMEATAKRELTGEAWRMEFKQEVEVPSEVHGGQAEQPKDGETMADLRHYCPVTDPWVSWDDYGFNIHN